MTEQSSTNLDSTDLHSTERSNPKSRGLDELSVRDALRVFQHEDERMLAAVDACADELAGAIELIAERLERGGRLIYAGAGTSGRLGLLDAAECPPTFGSDPEQVQAVLAGGPDALVRAVEDAEDSADEGARAVERLAVSEHDVVLGITASGTTPFVRGALSAARGRGAATIILACVPEHELGVEADLALLPVVGPEVLAGSTRLKAGTATKILLGRLTTLVMTRLGKVHDNLMVDVITTGNQKLRARGIHLVRELTGAAEGEAERLLSQAAGRVKTAVVMHARNCSPEDAEERLRSAAGHLRRALRSD